MRKKLQQLREKGGYTQQSISRELGISRSCYSMIELGQRNPSLKVYMRIKSVLKYQYDDIFLLQKDPKRGIM